MILEVNEKKTVKKVVKRTWRDAHNDALKDAAQDNREAKGGNGKGKKSKTDKPQLG